MPLKFVSVTDHVTIKVKTTIFDVHMADFLEGTFLGTFKSEPQVQLNMTSEDRGCCVLGDVLGVRNQWLVIYRGLEGEVLMEWFVSSIRAGA